MVAVLHRLLYLQDCTYIQYIHTYRCNLLVKVYTSAKQDTPPASDMASDHGWHTHAHILTNTHIKYACEAAVAHTFLYLYTRKWNTHPSSHTYTRFNTILSSDNWHKGSPGGSFGHVCFTSLHLPLYNNQVLKYHQTNQGQETSAAFPGRRHATESPAPSSLSSSYASPPPDLLGTEGRKRERERESRANKKMKRWAKEEKCKTREVSEGVQSGDKHQ